MKRDEEILQRILKKISVGAMTGLIVYFVLLLIRSPVEEILAAFLIGSVPGIIDQKKLLIFLYALSCSTGWIMGLLLFGVFLELGLGSWIIAGAFLGFICGVFNSSFLRGV